MAAFPIGELADEAGKRHLVPSLRSALVKDRLLFLARDGGDPIAALTFD